jgi:very-short-patch-repair endonuclease
MNDNSDNSNIPCQKQKRIRGKDKNTTIDNPKRWALMKSQYLTDADLATDTNTRDFESYGPNSNKNVWWKCSLEHPPWQASLCNRYRSKGNSNGCPYCSGRKVCNTNCLAFINPILALEWHPNNTLTANDVTPGCNTKVLWKCSKKSEHEWEATINSRTKGTGCPHCNGKTTADGNTLADKFPELVAEWHPTENDCTPLDITPGSDRVVWWICPKKKHEYQAKVGNRTKNQTGCPYCAGKKVCEDNSFAKCYPEIAKEWSPKNENGPDMYSKCSGQYVWWKCSDNHEWYVQISNRVKGDGKGCPYCSGRLATEERNLALVHPHLIAEWHPRNETTPEQHTPASHSKVWWICSKNKSHTWQAQINNRTSTNKSNCPKCNMSKLELETERVLNKLEVNFEQEKIFDDLPQYRYDFFVPEWNTLIECDGVQHFSEDSKFYKARTNAKSFNEQQKSDKEKDEYALVNSYSIIRIAYTEQNNIEHILTNYSKVDKTTAKLFIHPEHMYI